MGEARRGVNRRSQRLKIIKMFENLVTRLLFNKDCQSMRLIRKLALQKQKHTKREKEKKSLFPASEGACGSSARSRGSVFRIHNSGHERAPLLLSGQRPAGRLEAGRERLGEYSCRLRPLQYSARLGCPDPLEIDLRLAFGFLFLSISLPTRL